MAQPAYDVIIVGAGISGLACAQELLKKNLKVLILEAQSRVGGRIYTQREPGLQTPMELGAEFIHGTPSSTMKPLESLGVPIYDGCDNHLFFEDGRLKKFHHFWDDIGKVMEKLDGARKKDRSISDFLETQKNLNPKVKAAFISFVEGFHSADIHKMSEKGLSQAEQTDESELNQSKIFRIPGGYDQLVQGIYHSFPCHQEILRLNTIVKKIKWGDHAVAITAHSATGVPIPTLTAKSVVITVPLGVLKSSPASQAGIEFDPMPEKLEEALSGIEMGDVQRITFRFRTRFWEDLTQEPIGFLHAGPEKYFPTWWTMMPMRTPLLVAWQGGPRASELAKWSEEQRVKAALMTLSEMTGKSLTFLSEQLEGWATHNWTNDPYFLGAYSYILVDGMTKSEILTKGFSDSLYFAGEATASSSLRGTVNGAFDSGVRTAQLILKKFKNLGPKHDFARDTELLVSRT